MIGRRRATFVAFSQTLLKIAGQVPCAFGG
jgi:hypothetical protein